MADEESFLDEDVTGGQDVEVGQKTGFLPSLVIKILKWAVAGIAAILFIIAVVVVTTNFLNQGRRSSSVPIISEEYAAAPEIMSWYENFDPIRTRTADEASYTVVARVALGYKQDDKQIWNELGNRSRLLQHLIRSYFTQKTANELHPRNETIIVEELLEKVNAVMTSGKVKQVILLEYNLIQM
ncbi:MAG: flagellar basal body protein FliL [Spirochaetales bacterium]|nr:flagellar basal body protein FliL [Spirochaetales bacterium]